MAEKKAAGKEDDAAAPAAGGNRKKLLLIAGGGGVLVLVLGIALGWLLLGGKGEDSDSADAEQEQVAAPPAIYVALGDKFTVTLPGEGKPHYLQVGVSVLTRDPAVVEEIKFNLPLLRDRLDGLFARQAFDALRTDEGKQALRAEVLGTVQGIVADAMAGAAAATGDEDEEEDEDDRKSGAKGKDEASTGAVEQVFFTDFVLQ